MASKGDTFGDGNTEDSQRNGHASFEVLDVQQDRDPLGIREMPHIDAGGVDIGGKSMDVVDLRIELYPVPQQEKQRLMRAFSKTGVVGELQGELIHFKQDSVEVIDPVMAKQLPRLPKGWSDHMKFVAENRRPVVTPKMVSVFRRK